MNKHAWIYKFSYENDYWGNSEYSVETSQGFKIAEYYANNNMMWDAGKNLTYHGKRRKV